MLAVSYVLARRLTCFGRPSVPTVMLLPLYLPHHPAILSLPRSTIPTTNQNSLSSRHDLGVDRTRQSRRRIRRSLRLRLLDRLPRRGIIHRGLECLHPQGRVSRPKAGE